MLQDNPGAGSVERCLVLYDSILQLGERLTAAVQNPDAADWTDLLEERDGLVHSAGVEVQRLVRRGVAQADRLRLQELLGAVVAQNRVLEQTIRAALHDNTGQRVAMNQAKETVGAYRRVGVAREAIFLDHKK